MAHPLTDSRIEIAVDAHVSVVHVGGELDLATAPGLERFVVALDADVSPDLRLDLSGVTFLDAAGMGSLVRITARHRASGGTARITGASHRIARLLALGGLTGLATDPPSELLAG